MHVICVCQETSDGDTRIKFGLSMGNTLHTLTREETAFVKVYLHTFRDNLRSYKLHGLSEYLEAKYFKEDCIKQWSCWYRVKIFNCEWILDTNMHVEAWHDVLKSHVMDKKRNIRIDKLLQILRSTETKNFCKWTCTEVGIKQHADDRWLAMRGVETSAASQSTSGYVNGPE